MSEYIQLGQMVYSHCSSIYASATEFEGACYFLSTNIIIIIHVIYSYCSCIWQFRPITNCESNTCNYQGTVSKVYYTCKIYFGNQLATTACTKNLQHTIIVLTLFVGHHLATEDFVGKLPAIQEGCGCMITG